MNSMSNKSPYKAVQYTLKDPLTDQQLSVVYTTAKYKGHRCRCCGKEIVVGNPFYWDVTHENPYDRLVFLPGCGERLIGQYKTQSNKKPVQDTSKFITVQQATEEINISASSIYQYIRDGLITSTAVGGKRAISKSDLPKILQIKYSNNSRASADGHKTRALIKQEKAISNQCADQQIVNLLGRLKDLSNSLKELEKDFSQYINKQ